MGMGKTAIAGDAAGTTEATGPLTVSEFLARWLSHMQGRVRAVTYPASASVTGALTVPWATLPERNQSSEPSTFIPACGNEVSRTTHLLEHSGPRVTQWAARLSGWGAEMPKPANPKAHRSRRHEPFRVPRLGQAGARTTAMLK